MGPRSTSASIDRSAGRADLHLARDGFHRANEAGRIAGGEQLLGLVPVPEVPGDDSVTSRRPSLVLEAPSQMPPVVWALAV